MDEEVKGKGGPIFCGKDENDVRSILGAVWNEPSNTQEAIKETIVKNQNLFEFEKELTY